MHGLKLHYRIEGRGAPLVYIPPALGSADIKSFPALTEIRTVISVDLQGHGRTADIPDRPITLEQCAKDVVALLDHLGIRRADFFGESYGGVIATMIALQHPARVGRVATFGATFGPPAEALNWAMLRTRVTPTADSPAFRHQRTHYRKVAPDPRYWPRFWSKVCSIQWGGFPRKKLAALRAPLLIALGDHDFVRVEHALETLRLVPRAELAVIPDAGHFALYSEPDKVIPVVTQFLRAPATKRPIGTAETGYQPGRTR